MKFPEGWGQSFAAASAVGALGFGAFAMGDLEPRSRFNEDHTTQSAIAEVLAPSVASTVGRYDALAERGETFSDAEGAMREKLESRFDNLRAAAPNDKVRKDLDTYYGFGFQDVIGGHVSTEDVSLQAIVVLAAENQLYAYAEIGQARLVEQGLTPEAADTAYGGLVASEMWRNHLGRDVSPEGFVADSPYDPEIKASLTAQIPNISASVEMLHESSRAIYFKIKNNSYAAWERGELAVQKSIGNPTRGDDAAGLAPDRSPRPKARADDPERAMRVAMAAQARSEREGLAPSSSPRPAARSDLADRVRQQAEMRVATKRPVSRPSRDDDRDI